MNPLSATELSRMRATQAETMFDECKLGTVTESLDASNTYTQPTTAANATYGSAMACGFDPGMQARETRDGSQAPLSAPTLRLPLTAAITNVMYVQLTKRHSTALSPVEYYRVAGNPMRGPTAFVISLELVTGSTMQ